MRGIRRPAPAIPQVRAFQYLNWKGGGLVRRSDTVESGAPASTDARTHVAVPTLFRGALKSHRRRRPPVQEYAQGGALWGCGAVAASEPLGPHTALVMTAHSSRSDSIADRRAGPFSQSF